MSQGRHVLFKRRFQMRRVRWRGHVRWLWQNRRRRCCRRWWGYRVSVLLGQSLIRFHNLRDGKGEISAGCRGSHSFRRQARWCLGRHCIARREWLHSRPAMKTLTVKRFPGMFRDFLSREYKSRKEKRTQFSYTSSFIDLC